LLEIREARVVIQGQDGNAETLTLPSGNSISTSWTPRNPGVYAVDFIVTGITPNGSVIERTGFLAIEVQPNPSNALITFNLLFVVGIVLVVLLMVLLVIFSAVRLFRRVREQDN
jgi:hypothetical protein